MFSHRKLLIRSLVFRTIMAWVVASQSADGKVAGKPCYFQRDVEIREMTNGRIGMMATEDPNFRSYRARLISKLLRVWHPPKRLDGKEGYALSALITIQSDGHIGKCELEKSSGIQVADEKVLQAVRKVDGFEKLPDSVGKDTIIELLFRVHPQVGKRPIKL